MQVLASASSIDEDVSCFEWLQLNGSHSRFRESAICSAIILFEAMRSVFICLELRGSTSIS